MSSVQTTADRPAELDSRLVEPLPPAKLLADWRRKALVAVGAAVLLVLGWLTLPPARPAATAPAEERVAPLLEAELARRQPASGSDRVQEVGMRALPYTLAVTAASAAAPRAVTEPALAGNGELQRQAAGVVVTRDGLILSHADALGMLPRATIETSAGVAQDVDLIAYEATSGLVLLAASGSAWPIPSLATARPAPGTPLVAAAPGSAEPLLAPVFVAAMDAEHYRVLGGGALPPGMPIFDEEGKLLAVYGRNVAHDAAAALHLLRALRDAGHGHRAASGLVLQSTNPTLAPWFGDDGVIVTNRAEPGPAARAGLRPGDVLVTLNGVALESPEHLHFLVSELAPGQAVVLSGRRAGRPAMWNLVPGTAFEMRQARIRQALPENAAQLSDVLPSSWTGTVRSGEDEAPVPLDAILLPLAGVAGGSPAELSRRLKRDRRGVLLYLENAGERYFAVAREAGA